MPVPKRKRSRARRDSRFANKGVKVKSFATCANCSEPLLPHQACANCGFYKGRKVMATKVERAVKRGKAREQKAARSATAAAAPGEENKE
jgi:large subunit ribosomal protein L32